jgi:hypothetical protein
MPPLFQSESNIHLTLIISASNFAPIIKRIDDIINEKQITCSLMRSISNINDLIPNRANDPITITEKVLNKSHT